MKLRSTLVKFAAVIALLPFANAPLQAQLAAPNEAGVSMGAVTLNVASVEDSAAFWQAAGATRIKIGKQTAMKMPGTLLILHQATPTDASAGSSFDHIGITVKDGLGFLEMMRGKGMKADAPPKGCTGPLPTNCGFAYTKDNLKLEVFEDKTLATPIAFHHVHFFTMTPSREERRDWYVKRFDAIPGTAQNARSSPEGVIPGASLRFNLSPTETAPTAGRAIDSTGFEIKGLQAFCKKLETEDVHFTVPYHKENGIASATFLDPAGITVILTEGLNKL